MKARNRIILLSILFSLLISTKTAHANSNADKVNLLFTHDLHSYIDPVSISQDGEQVEVGGFARIQSLINQSAAENPATFILDAGDFAMGTLFQSVYSDEALELRLLGQMGYDVVTIGNHEFDYRGKGFSDMLKAASASGDPLPQMVQSNIDWDTSPGENKEEIRRAMMDYPVKNYVIIERENIKVAVFGLIGESAASYSPTSGLTFANIVTAAEETISSIKAAEPDVDLIVALSHSGTSPDVDKSEDEILAKKVPEIDVIISGHSHTLLEEPIVIEDTIIVSAGEYGRYLGNLQIEPNEEGRWKVSSYETIPVNSSVVPDSTLEHKIDDYRELLVVYLNRFGFESSTQVIADNPYAFDTVQQLYADNLDNPLGNLIADSYAYEVKKVEGENYKPVDFTVVPVGIIRASINKGPVKVKDAYEVLSLGVGEDGLSGYPLLDVYLYGSELRTVAEIDASISSMMEGSRLYWSGLYSEVNLNRLFLDKIVNVMQITSLGEKIPIEEEKLYRVVVGLYSGQMLGAVQSMSKGLLELQPKDQDGNPVTDLSQIIIHDQDGNEVKEWFAFADYLGSFEQKDGISVIPEDYSKSAGRKEVAQGNSLADKFKNPSDTILKIIGLGIGLVVLLVVIIVFIVKFVRKHKRTKKID